MNQTNQAIRSYRGDFYTNIKNLPEGEYLTETGYSQSYPWKVIATSPSGKTITLQKVEVATDPEWKPKFIAGGFTARCTNQNEQTHIFVGLSDRLMTVRLKKSRYCGSDKLWGNKGTEFIANGAVEHYDYNF